MCRDVVAVCSEIHKKNISALCRQNIENLNGTGQLKCDGTQAETGFHLSAKRTSPFKSAGGISSVDYWQPRCAHQR